MVLSRTKSRLAIPAPPPSPIPTGTGSRSAANESFKQFLEKPIHLPQLSLPESRFVSGNDPSPAVVDFQSLDSPGGDATARMIQSANEFGSFRIVNHGISGEEILSVVNEAKCRQEKWVEKVGNRQTILQVRRRNDSKAAENTVVQAETYRQISEKMEKIASKLEGIGEKLSEILSKCMEEKWVENVKKETIFSIYKHKHKNLFERENNNAKNNEKEETKSDGSLMMSLHIPGEHCQFFVNSHDQQPSFCFDAGADTIVVTVGKRLQEWSLGKLKSARSEMIFVPDLVGSPISFSMELKISNPNSLKNYQHSKIISISDQILIAFLLLFFYFLYTCI